MMGESLAQTICGTPTKYEPGIWFNSAKFVDLEYQVYGDVPTTYKGDLTSVFWQEETPERSLRIVYSKSTNNVKGFNAIGLRLRHEVCDDWIKSEKSIEYVLSNLDALNFDPEFCNTYSSQVKAQFEALV